MKMNLEVAGQLLRPAIKTEYSRRNIAKTLATMKDRVEAGLIPEEQLTPIEKVGNYLGALKDAKPWYYQEVQQLADQSPPLDPNTSCIVAIPVVGFGGQAERIITRTLDVFSSQTIQDGNLEINCFINKPPGVIYDRTPKIIREYTPKNANVSVSVTQAEIQRKQKSEPLMGKIRGLQIDAILLRIYEALKQSPDKPLPIIVLADDDTEGANPRTLQNYLEAFRANKAMDASIGKLTFDNREYPSILFPPLYLADELMYQLPLFNKAFLNKLGLRKEPINETDLSAMAINLFDSSFTKGVQINLAFRPEAYAASGGAFEATKEVNELDLFLRMISLPAMLKRRCNIGALGEEVEVISNSRRALLAYLQGEGLAPINQWRSEQWKIRVNDPARTAKPSLVGVIPLGLLPEGGMVQLTKAMEQQVRQTTGEYQPLRTVPGWYDDSSQAYFSAFEAVGLQPADYSFRLTADGTSFRFLGIPESVVERLKSLQEEKLRRLEILISKDLGSIRDGFIVDPAKTENERRFSVFNQRYGLPDYRSTTALLAPPSLKEFVRLPIRYE